MSADGKIRKIQATADAMRRAAVYGANVYANGVADGAEKPIVDQHFTAGNQLRYDWDSLSIQYAKWKLSGATETLQGNVMFLNKIQRAIHAATKGKKAKSDYIYEANEGRTASKPTPETLALDFNNNEIKLAGGQPMLVLTGALRAAVSGGKGANRHPVHATPNGAVVTFRNLPKYAIFLHEGDGTPMRSPVDPNELDRAQVVAAMSRYVDAAGGTGGAVPVSRTTIPGRARFV